MPLALALALVLAACAAGEVTYSREVSRIIQAKCQQCHRPNDITPFALMSYEDMTTHAEQIRHAVRERIMPPWKPVAGFGEFQDFYALSDEERTTLLDWIAAGMSPGDPADSPEPLPVSSIHTAFRQSRTSDAGKIRPCRSSALALQGGITPRKTARAD